MRSQTIRATAVEGIRSFALESERMFPAQGDPVLSPVPPAWRRRAIDPEGEGVSLRFAGRMVDMTGRLMVQS